MNSFYRLPKSAQWFISIFLMGVPMGLITVWSVLYSTSLWPFLLLPFLMPIYYFTSTPFLTITDTYHYLSPMLLAYKPSEEKYWIHLGTSFDYFMVMRKLNPGSAVKQTTLLFLVDGLLEIIERIETKRIPESVQVVGSSHFFNDKTALRMGFTLSPTTTFEKINFGFAYLEVMWMHSMAQGKLSWPKIMNLKTATSTGEILLSHKEEYLKLKGLLEYRLKSK